jgi:hypothetical protein
MLELVLEPCSEKAGEERKYAGLLHSYSETQHIELIKYLKSN